MKLTKKILYYCFIILIISVSFIIIDKTTPRILEITVTDAFLELSANAENDNSKSIIIGSSFKINFNLYDENKISKIKIFSNFKNNNINMKKIYFNHSCYYLFN